MSNDGYAPDWLEVEKQLGGRPALQEPWQEYRAQYDPLLAALASQWQPLDASIATTDQQIDENVGVRIFTPPASGDSKLPICLHLHGGGFLAGNLDSEAPHCRYIASKLPCIVVSVEYRLCPEHKLPIPIDDCCTAFEWAYSNAERLGGDPAKCFVLGGSAGAALALQTVQRLVSKAETKSRVRTCIAFSPIAVHPKAVPEKYISIYTAYTDNAVDTPVITAKVMLQTFPACGMEAAPRDPDFLPVWNDNLKHFPPTWISTCGKDPLRDDGVVLERTMEDVGVRVKRVHYEGYPHYFHIFPTLEKRVQFMDDVVSGINWAFGK